MLWGDVSPTDGMFDPALPVIGPFQGPWRILSNFYPLPVQVPLDAWPVAWGGGPGLVCDGASTEHVYQQMKWLRRDPVRAELARLAPTPSAAKRAGSGHPEGWAGVSLLAMELCIRAKFASGGPLATALVATGLHPLAEINTWGDTFYGVCGGRGCNHLGRLLMEQRRRLVRGA